jgi:hypothetical protein
MPAETWLSFSEQVQLVRARLSASVGRSEALVRQAHASGEVRPEPLLSWAQRKAPAGMDPVSFLLMTDDGVVGMDLRPGAWKPGGVDRNGNSVSRRHSKDDLLDWLDRQTLQHPQQGKAGERKRAQDMRDVADHAIATLWPNGSPTRAELPNKRLCGKVKKWLEANSFAVPSDTTILRAAGRRK